MIVRQHLNIPAIQSYQPNTDLREGILKEALRSPVLLSYWETIAHCIPSMYEKYSIELLKVIIELWITIRGHSLLKTGLADLNRSVRRAQERHYGKYKIHVNDLVLDNTVECLKNIINKLLCRLLSIVVFDAYVCVEVVQLHA